MKFSYAVVSLTVALGIAGGCQKAATSFAPAAPSPVASQATHSQGGISSRPLNKPTASSKTLFRRLHPKQTGLRFINPLDPSHPMRYLYHSGTSCGGVAIGDVDGDDRPDIFLLSGPNSNKLFRQSEQPLQFEDVTAKAGMTESSGWSCGAAMIDIENDGDLDIYVCNYDAANQLFINDGGGQFTEQAAKYGVNVVDASLMPAFADFDLDGDLDFYLLTNSYYDPEGLPQAAEDYVTTNNGRLEVRNDKQKYWSVRIAADGKNWGLGPFAPPDRLFRNDGERFTEVTEQAGISGFGDGLSATWWDFDSDGDPDIYVGNDFDAPDHLYRNNGDGTFTDVIKDTVPHSSWFSMGADVGDINNDGLLDFLTADMSAKSHFMQKTTMGAMGSQQAFVESSEPPQYMRNALYLNTGTHRFMEVAYLAGLSDTDWTWSVKLADFDNDGRNDVFVTNGAARNTTDSDVDVDPRKFAGRSMWDQYRDQEPRQEQNLTFRNDGDLHFKDVSAEWGLDHVGMSYAAAHSDLDRDGDLDLVVVNLGEPVDIYQNHSMTRNRVVIRLKGVQSNRNGIGATVRLATQGGIQTRQLKANSGFMASDEAIVHFGLGTAERIESLSVRWPSRGEQTFTDLAANRFYTIREPDSQSDQPTGAKGRQAGSSSTRAVDRTAMFTASDVLKGLGHFERDFDDYRLQPLLPSKLSQLGPGMAWGDIDGDEDQDLFYGGAAGTPGRLMRNDGNETFFTTNRNAFRQDAECEDMGSLMLDIDADGDLDLYVVSGGVEAKLQAHLQDRVYLNDGKGNFARAPQDVLPQMMTSGGVVVGADYDRDGDVDLFVGGRVIPSKYPSAPNSYLLENDRGRFKDATAEVAPAIARTGLVTSAVWSDANDDGWPDLLVAHEWGPVKLFRNEQGKLVDETQTAGLAERVGWWNGISPGDLNGDGRIDYVVTNFGLNTKYQASDEKPALLYYGDFQQNGIPTIVEAEFEQDHLYPIRGKSCSTAAMPFLASKFTTYKDFALAELADIYTTNCLKEAQRFAANTLESGVYFNVGDGKFRFEPLPRIAQAAPAFGAAVVDVNLDGRQDVFLVQNFFSPQPETGRMDGGLSLLMLGDGTGKLRPIWPYDSGIVVPGDAKSLTITDFNDDGRVDFLIGINSADAKAYVNNIQTDGKSLTIRLRGKSGNPMAIGARVTLALTDGNTQVQEIYGGHGYLSQCAGPVIFSLPAGSVAKEAIVRWPTGVETRQALGKLGHATIVESETAPR